MKSLLVPGLAVLVGGFVVYMQATALLIAAGLLLMLLGLWMVLSSLSRLPRLYRYLVFLALGLYLVVQGSNLFWDSVVKAANNPNGTYDLPFVAFSAPYYVANDLAITMITVGAALLFLAGLGFGRIGKKLRDTAP